MPPADSVAGGIRSGSKAGHGSVVERRGSFHASVFYLHRYSGIMLLKIRYHLCKPHIIGVIRGSHCNGAYIGSPYLRGKLTAVFPRRYKLPYRGQHQNAFLCGKNPTVYPL